VPFASPRLAREWKTIQAMVRLYCRHQHGSSGVLCSQCQELVDYAGLRLKRCRFGSEKPTCAKCPVHCYQPDHRTRIKAVMRFTGPRMLWERPALSLRHWLDSLSSRRVQTR
jgi:Nitrous oxide-stimulated promoter